MQIKREQFDEAMKGVFSPLQAVVNVGGTISPQSVSLVLFSFLKSLIESAAADATRKVKCTYGFDSYRRPVFSAGHLYLVLAEDTERCLLMSVKKKTPYVEAEGLFVIAEGQTELCPLQAACLLRHLNERLALV